MRLTDETVRGIEDDTKSGHFIEPCDIPPCYLIHALATEVLESRAEIKLLTRERDEAVRLGRAGAYKANPEYTWAGWAADRQKELDAAEARVAELEALLDVDRLTDIITDSIDLDWTPRDAARAIVRAMGGAGDDNG